MFAIGVEGDVTVRGKHRCGAIVLNKYFSLPAARSPSHALLWTKLSTKDWRCVSVIPADWEAETRESPVQGQLEQLSKTLPRKKNF